MRAARRCPPSPAPPAAQHPLRGLAVPGCRPGAARSRRCPASRPTSTNTPRARTTTTFEEPSPSHPPRHRQNPHHRPGIPPACTSPEGNQAPTNRMSNRQIFRPSPEVLPEAGDGSILPTVLYEEARQTTPRSMTTAAGRRSSSQLGSVPARGKPSRSNTSACHKHFGLSQDVQYDWSTDDAQIARRTGVFLTGRLTMIGSANPAQQPWMWTWANESLPHAILRNTERVRQSGKGEQLPPSSPGRASTTTPNSSQRHGWSRPACCARRCGPVDRAHGRSTTPLHGPQPGVRRRTTVMAARTLKIPTPTVEH